MKSYFTLSILSLLVSITTYAQCPFGNGTKVNCIYGCGRFVDTNADGFCDNGLVEKIDQLSQTNDIVTDSSNETAKKVNKKVKENSHIFSLTSSNSIIPLSERTQEVNKKQTQTSQLPTTKKLSDKPYPIVQLCAAVLLFYVFTLLGVRNKIIKKITHRRIWNCILLISFILSCIGGLFLIIQMNYAVAMELLSFILSLHVWTGIVFALVGIIHILWHLPYFSRIITHKKKIKQ